MTGSPKLKLLDERIRRSKQTGKLVVGAVALISVPFLVVLVQGLALALADGNRALVVRGLFGLGLLAGLNLLSIFLIRRQHRMLDEARKDLLALVEGKLPD